MGEYYSLSNLLLLHTQTWTIQIVVAVVELTSCSLEMIATVLSLMMMIFSDWVGSSMCAYEYIVVVVVVGLDCACLCVKIHKTTKRVTKIAESERERGWQPNERNGLSNFQIIVDDDDDNEKDG